MNVDLPIRASYRPRLAWLLAFSVCLSFPLRAEDIVLKDGRAFKDAKVISETPTTVFIRYQGGATSVAKTLLPEKLRAQYPLAAKAVAEAKAKEATNAKTIEAAEQGNAPAQFELGRMYDHGEGVAKDPVEAVKWYRKAAEQGNASAQYSFGYMYAHGEGVAKDPVEAVKWYRKAAEQGDARAQGNLGYMYSNGEGVAKDPVEAVKWYRKAAEQGDGLGQRNLGSCYFAGDGVPKNEIEALAWFSISAASGLETAKESRDFLEGYLGRSLTLAAQQRSIEIMQEIAAAEARTATATQPLPATAPPEAASAKCSGSGAIVSASGHVLTAAHVVLGSSKIVVITAQGSRNAKILRVDEANDLAVLKLDSGTYQALPVAPSRRIRLGQSVATIGFPNLGIQGFSPKVTRGEISSLNGVGDDPTSWQISVPVQPGNSGGPLIDENGNLVGIVVSKLGLRAAAATHDIPQNVNYAVKSAYALPLLEPYLGGDAPEPSQSDQKPSFEDMVAKAQQSVVLVLCY
jgi:TPR repeat protein